MESEFKCYSIKSKSGSVVASFIPQRGGVMSSLKVSGRELLYRHPEFWDDKIDDLPGAWPLCFPICARLSHNGEIGAYEHDGVVYKMPIHGVAWWSEWQVVSIGDSYIELELKYNDQTLAMYPFKFLVNLRYELTDNELICRQRYTNNSTEPMPYYAGFHPYFSVPEDKSLVQINFKPVKRFIYNDDYTQIVGEQDLFELPCTLDNPDLNEQLTQLGADKMATLKFADGFELSINCLGDQDPDMFAFMQLYTMHNRPFFCVEPWMAPPNSLNNESARLLGVNQTDSARLRLSWNG
ncbi:MAG: aldose epimerase [Candidatus Thioglobus sp.]